MEDEQSSAPQGDAERTAQLEAEFAQIVAQRKQEREAESVGVTAWIASKFSGTVTIATMLLLIAFVVLIGALALSNDEGDPCSS